MNAAAKTAWPPGVNHLFTFFFFNFLSVMIVMDSPIFLYTQSLGASATVMGLIAGLTPLMVVFQIPAADHVNRIGYKRFITTGWTVRLVFIAGLAVVPFTNDASLNQQSKLALVLAMLFLFNLVRGISSCGWFPWITGLVPGNVRGRYLTIENACNSVGSLVAFLLVAAYLGREPASYKFGVLFAFSFVIGLVSLAFIYRVPSVPTPEAEKNIPRAVPWSEIMRHPPFRKLLLVAACWAAAMGGLMAFLVKYLKSAPYTMADGGVVAGMPDDLVMYAASAKFAGSLLTLWFLATRLDRMGSRPIMYVGLGLWVLLLGGWAAMAGGVFRLGFVHVLGLYLGMGFAFAMFSMATTKLAMDTVPAMGRSHFFALYSVVCSLTAGLMPIMWGLLIDILQPVDVAWLGLGWNQYSIYFIAVTGVLLAAMVLIKNVEETKAARMDEFVLDLIRNSPLRSWFRD